MGFSGFIEVVGLMLWGYELFANMREGKRLERAVSVADGSKGRFQLTPQTKVADVLANYPESLPIFIDYGFAPLANPVLRKTMARVVTLEQACRREGVDLQSLMTKIRAASLQEVAPVQITRN